MSALDNRQSLSRAVFAACKAHGLDDDARRAVVENVTGKTSMSLCNAHELGLVLDRLNGKPGGYVGRRRVTPAADRAALRGKVDALLAELHRVTGKVYPLAYADAIARRNGWAENVDFADPCALQNIIAALKRTLRYSEKAGTAA
jgi:phage gp16-like protein